MTLSPDNSKLINDFRNGEEAAVRQLYSLHYRGLCYFAEKLIDDRTEAEDIAVDTFLKLLKKKTDFENLSDIKSFLYTATRNACIDYLRKNKRRKDADREIRQLLAPDDTPGESEMIIARVLQVIYTEVEKLPPQCRQVFKLIFLEGKTTSLVAGEMQISTQTVLNQKAKAVRILKLAVYSEGLLSTALFFHCLAVLQTMSPLASLN